MKLICEKCGHDNTPKCNHLFRVKDIRTEGSVSECDFCHVYRLIIKTEFGELGCDSFSLEVARQKINEKLREKRAEK